MIIYAFTIFTSAFLLFQIQPIIAKYILPWFGGTPSVWSTCMLFFQCLLLAGYLYAHWISKDDYSEKQKKIHLPIIVISFLLLIITSLFWRAPIFPGSNWINKDSEFPILNIIVILGVSVGLPFFVLSTTGPLVQKWFSLKYPCNSPYWLYSLSNLGSLLGLILYPFVIEPVFRLGVQAWIWSLLFFVYGVLCVILLSKQTSSVKRQNNENNEANLKSEGALITDIEPWEKFSNDEHKKPGISDRILWVLLPMAASLIFLAVTNQLCQEVAVFPFLWVVPLSIYLLSFIFCFGHARWYPGWLASAFFPACLVMMFLVLVMTDMSLRWQVISYSVCLFLICMGCHGELVRLKPAPKHLTLFYLCISIGGATGGIFVAILAPLIFKGFYELHVGILFSFLLMLYAVFLKRNSLKSRYYSFTSGLLLFASLMIISIAASSDWDIIREIFKRRFLHTPAPFEPLSIKWTWLYGVGFSGICLAIFYFIGQRAIKRMHGIIECQSATQSKIAVKTAATVIAIIPLISALSIGFISIKEVYTGYKDDLKIFKNKWLYSSRNFFGVLHVSSKTTLRNRFAFPDILPDFFDSGVDTDDEAVNVPEEIVWYKLIHGSIIHGMQAAEPEIRKIPCTYYAYKSGVGLILLNHPKRTSEGNKHLRVGAIGLGTGTLAAYFNEGDYICFYDINPTVPEIALGKGGYFHYLQDAKERGAKIDIVLGDGRLSMERELKVNGSKNYDVIVLDAFSSDAIPVHLLTKEAFEIYLKHLTERGVLAVHVSNRYLDLDPVVWKVAEKFGLEAILVSSKGNDSEGIFSASWVLLTYDKNILKNEEIAKSSSPMPENLSDFSLWTDDYSNLFRYLRK